jgi:hypothetical protein
LLPECFSICRGALVLMMPIYHHGGNDIGHRSDNFRFHLSNFGIACFEAARLSAETENAENFWVSS